MCGFGGYWGALFVQTITEQFLYALKGALLLCGRVLSITTIVVRLDTKLIQEQPAGSTYLPRKCAQGTDQSSGNIAFIRSKFQESHFSDTLL